MFLKSILFIIVYSSFVFAEDSYELLEKKRNLMTFPPLTKEERVLVLDQVKMVLNDMFVHRDLKIKNWGEEANPQLALEDLEKKLENLTEEEFHQRISDIFTKLHDRHTTYFLPKPLACIVGVLPIGFRSVTNSTGEQNIVIGFITSKKKVLDLLPERLKIDKGDILIEYDGKPVDEAIRDLSLISYGANADAIYKLAIRKMSIINFKYHIPFKQNEARLKLKNKNNEIYETTIPWIASFKEECVNPPPPTEEIETEGLGIDEDQIIFNRIFQQHDKKSGEFKQTSEPSLYYRTLTNENGTFGHLVLESFMPTVLSIDDVLKEIIKILKNDFKETDGLIFDVRSNGGGWIRFGEKLIQLFTPQEINPMNFIIKNSSPNRFYFEQAFPESPFATVLRNAMERNIPYADAIPLNDKESLNLLGQYYFKPIAVFNNAVCYSTCDTFSAHIQDYEVGIIFGEDKNSGAGGANNMDLSFFLTDLDLDEPGPYKKLPQGIDIGFSYRQMVRVGTHANQLIEDTGIISDKVLAPTMEDLLNDDMFQFKSITEYLKEKSPLYTSSIQIPHENIDLKINEPANLIAAWKDTDLVHFIENKTLIGSSELLVEDSINFPEQFDTKSIRTGKLELLGKKNDSRVWRKFISYRIVPPFRVMDENQNILLNFIENNTDILSIYNPQNGWRAAKEELRIGTTEEYENSMSTTASLFVTLPANGEYDLSLKAKIQTEQDFDFFNILIRCNGETEALLKNASGEIDWKDYQYSLAKYKGKSVEIQFVFNTDANTVDKGIFLDDLSLKPSKTDESAF